ncbi:SDR family oxidoreductase [Roseomonas hellenica]|nr:SDR family oxidoreductase [Plastoroseomonas hellenica]
MRVLILGGSGMLGHMAFRVFSAEPGLQAFATLRGREVRRRFPPHLQAQLLDSVDVLDGDALTACLSQIRPNVVVNCVGVVKQLATALDPLTILPLNALFPHRLARLCGLVGARLIHLSTDCVFRGDRGGYREHDQADADDLYGRSKLLGEVDAPHVVTIRTSIIGRELGTRHGLVEWYLGEQGDVRGFERALFSGLTTDELSRVLLQQILPHPDLHGIWHVSADPINKYDLLVLLREIYGYGPLITPDRSIELNRTLDSSRFRAMTGYAPPPWREMIRRMHELGDRNDP